jgi:ABC-2 type transport system ATP-binding protein
MLRKSLSAIAAALLAIALLPPTTASAEETIDHITVTSLAVDQIPIKITVFKPADASETNKVPVIFDSHGWGGSRHRTPTTTPSTPGASPDTTVRDLLDAGFGVVSIDQRGHGESGGLRNVQDPALEAQDIKAVIDFTATLDWVAHNTTIDPVTGLPVEIENDPILGAIGGSYGGGYQTITALTEISETGSTRFDALAPEITWFDLPTSLAPQGVPRTAWNTLLYAVSKAPQNKIAEYIDKAFVWGSASGHFPGSDPGLAAAETAAGIPNLTEIFRSHSPRGFVEDGHLLDVPSLWRQGITDNLFNLNEGINNFQKTLTDEARNRSLFVGYNGGHVLPGVGSTFPLGTSPGGSAVTGGASGDPCSDAVGGWAALRIEFFEKVFAGENPTSLLPTRYNLATNGGDCLNINSLGTLQSAAIAPIPGQDGWGTPTGLFAPHHYKLADGPITIAGIPRLTGAIVNAGVDTRAFFALSVGASPTAAGPASAPAPAPTVIQNNMTALRKLMPHAAANTDGQPFDIELPGVAIEIPAGQSLYLTISPISDASFGHGSKTPGVMVITDLRVLFPVVPPQ